MIHKTQLQEICPIWYDLVSAASGQNHLLLTALFVTCSSHQPRKQLRKQLLASVLCNNGLTRWSVVHGDHQAVKFKRDKETEKAFGWIQVRRHWSRHEHFAAIAASTDICMM